MSQKSNRNKLSPVITKSIPIPFRIKTSPEIPRVDPKLTGKIETAKEINKRIKKQAKTTKANKDKPVIRRRRGRPKKAESAKIEVTRKKRGRPRKVVQVDKPVTRVIPQTKQVAETFVVAKMFFADKPVSKQLDWYEDWQNRFRANHNPETTVELIDELVLRLNKFLKTDRHSLFANSECMSVHVPKILVTVDGKIIKIAFDPYKMGAEVHIFYQAKNYPVGASPSMKSTLVANRFTELVKSFLPIGTSG
jgi:hypothetical protein